MKKNCVYDKWIPVGSCDSSCKQNWKLTVKQEGENGGTACVPESRRNATTYCQYQFTPWKLDTTCTINNGKCQKAWRIGTTQPQCDSLIPENRRTVWIDCPSNACPTPTPTPTTQLTTQYPISTDGKCGPNFGNKRCSAGQCCYKATNTCVASSECKNDIRTNKVHVMYSDANALVQNLINENEKLEVSTNNICGGSGNKKCPNGECCSTESYKINGAAVNICEKDTTKCKESYGKYDYLYSDSQYLRGLLNTSSPAPSANYDGNCGPDFGNKKCSQGCCDNRGICYSNTEYCKKNLQSFINNLNYSDNTTKALISEELNRSDNCGPNYNNINCKVGCCSQGGSCVKNDKVCRENFLFYDPNYSESNIGNELRRLQEVAKRDEVRGCGRTKGNRKCEMGCCIVKEAKCNPYKGFCELYAGNNMLDFTYSADPQIESMASQYPYKYQEVKAQPQQTFYISSTDT